MRFEVDREQAEIVPFLGLEHGEDRGQRDRVEIIAEAHRGDAVERDFDVVGGEVAQRCRHQPHQAVEDDFEHRQALVRDHRRVDDRADAGILVERDVGEIEAEQRVDFLLIEDALGAALVAGLSELAAVLDHRRPLGGHIVIVAGGCAFRLCALLGERFAPFGCEVFLISHGYWTTISLNSTALMRVGATARLTRLVNSSRTR